MAGLPAARRPPAPALAPLRAAGAASLAEGGRRGCERALCALAVAAAAARRTAAGRAGPGLARQRVAGLGRRGRRRRALPKDLAELSPEDAVKVAARERAALRLGDISEEERQAIAARSDLLGPFRVIVQGLGAVALASALYDLAFVLIRLLTRSGRTGIPESVAVSDSESAVFTAFLVVLGVGLLYTGTVLMEPQPVPTMKEVLASMQEGEPAKAPPPEPDWTSLEGEWCYGKEGGQRYRVSRKEKKRAWRFDEELGGRAYSAALVPKGRWLQGFLNDADGKRVGTIRLRPGEGRTAVSYFMELGGVEWKNKNTASAAKADEAATESGEGA